MGWIRSKSSRSPWKTTQDGRRRYEHWHADNQLYFLTAVCRDHHPCFASEPAKAVFWDRFEHWTGECGFVPWATTLLSTHYHTVGYLREGRMLAVLMQRLHGSTAKLVNDLLPGRRQAFWRDRVRGKGKEYYDGCLRDETQCRRAYFYTLNQAVKAGLARRWQDYPHTRVGVELERGVRRALEIGAFMEGVRYPRYDERDRPRPATLVRAIPSSPPRKGVVVPVKRVVTPVDAGEAFRGIDPRSLSEFDG